MSNWKEHAHLFANGKSTNPFKVKYKGEVVALHGIRPKKGNWGTPVLVCWTVERGTFVAEIKDCTLIARPIEDMTDEEFEGLSFVNECIERQFFINLLKSRTDNDNLRFDDSRHLLSIGVYPFDQDDEDVIFEPKQ